MHWMTVHKWSSGGRRPSCSCNKTNMDTNQQLLLFVCSEICIEKANTGGKMCRVRVRSSIAFHICQKCLRQLAATRSEALRLDSLHITHYMTSSANFNTSWLQHAQSNLVRSVVTTKSQSEGALIHDSICHMWLESADANHCRTHPHAL